MEDAKYSLVLQWLSGVLQDVQPVQPIAPAKDISIPPIIPIIPDITDSGKYNSSESFEANTKSNPNKTASKPKKTWGQGKNKKKYLYFHQTNII